MPPHFSTFHRVALFNAFTFAQSTRCPTDAIVALSQQMMMRRRRRRRMQIFDGKEDKGDDADFNHPEASTSALDPLLFLLSILNQPSIPPTPPSKQFQDHGSLDLRIISAPSCCRPPSPVTSQLSPKMPRCCYCCCCCCCWRCFNYCCQHPATLLFSLKGVVHEQTS